MTTRKSRPVHQIKARVNQLFGEYIRRRRVEVGISQQDLSLELGHGPKYIWRVENQYTDVDLFEFVEIVEALGDKPEEVIRELM